MHPFIFKRRLGLHLHLHLVISRRFIQSDLQTDNGMESNKQKSNDVQVL